MSLLPDSLDYSVNSDGMHVETADDVDLTNDQLGAAEIGRRTSSFTRLIPDDDSVGKIGTNPTATVTSAFLNLSNTVVGAGVLSLPYAFMNGGLIGSALLLLFISVLSGVSFLLIVDISERTGFYSFKRIAEVVWSKKAGKVTEFFVLFYTLCSCIAYPTIIGGYVENVLGDMEFNIFGYPLVFTRAGVEIAVAAFIFAPLSLLKKVDFLRYTSFVALACVFYALIVVISHYVTDPISHIEHRGKLVYFETSKAFFMAPPLMVVANNAHYNVLNIYRELKDRTVEKMARVIFLTCVFCFLLYLTFGMTGYMDWRDQTPGNVLTAPYDMGNVILFARVGLSITISFSFPLTTMVSFRQRFILVVPIIAFCVAVAILSHSLAAVLELSGSTAGVMIVYIIPGVLYLKVPAGGGANKKKPRWKIVAAYTLVVCGIVFGICGTAVNLHKILTGGDKKG